MKLIAIFVLLILASSSSYGQITRVCSTNGIGDQLITIPCTQVPTFTKAENWHVIVVPERHITFWSIEPMRTNRETLRSPWFLVPHALAAIATTIAYKRAKGESATDAFVPLVALTGFDYVSDRFLWRPLSVGAAGYATALYTYGAATRTFH